MKGIRNGYGAITLLLGLCAVALSVLSPSAGFAQTPVALRTMIVSLLPQYDDPRLLIVFEAELSGPGQGYIAIPDAVELHSAEARRDDGTFQPIEAKFEGASDGRFISFDSPTASVRISFYQDVITRDSVHVLDFTLPGQRDALESLKWRAVFPLGSSDIGATPEMAGAGDVHYGMPGFLRNAGELAARTPATQQLRWTRASSAPSFAREVAPPASNTAVSEPPALTATTETTPTPTLPPVSANVNADVLAETTGRVARGETAAPTTTETPARNWVTAMRTNPIVWGAGALFVVGLLLVLDGLRKRRRQTNE